MMASKTSAGSLAIEGTSSDFMRLDAIAWESLGPTLSIQLSVMACRIYLPILGDYLYARRVYAGRWSGVSVQVWMCWPVFSGH